MGSRKTGFVFDLRWKSRIETPLALVLLNLLRAQILMKGSNDHLAFLVKDQLSSSVMLDLHQTPIPVPQFVRNLHLLLMVKRHKVETQRAVSHQMPERRKNGRPKALSLVPLLIDKNSTGKMRETVLVDAHGGNHVHYWRAGVLFRQDDQGPLALIEYEFWFGVIVPDEEEPGFGDLSGIEVVRVSRPKALGDPDGAVGEACAVSVGVEQAWDGARGLLLRTNILLARGQASKQWVEIESNFPLLPAPL
jgi:hypothetical protein